MLIEDLVNQGAIPQLVETLRRFAVGIPVAVSGSEGGSGSGSGSGSGPGDEVEVEIQCNMLHILASLAKDHLPR